MLRYLGRRLLQIIPVLIGATFIIYALVLLMPGDPIAVLGGDRGLLPVAETALRTRYNLDKPFIVQYLLYPKGIMIFDFGLTSSGREVTEVMTSTSLVTIKLAFMALAFEAILGITFGTTAGSRCGGVSDTTVLIVSLFVIAVPTFTIGFVMQFITGMKLEWLPTITAGKDNFVSLLIPAVMSGAVSFAYVLRLTRQSVSETAGANFVRTAKAKGLKNGRVTRVYTLHNSLILVVTFLGADLSGLVGGATVIEGIFAINGMGGNIYQAIIKGEPATAVSFTTVLVLVYIAANLSVDLLYVAPDPCTRYE